MAHNPFTVPCMRGLQNGHTLETHKRGNGSTLSGPASLLKSSKVPSNGISSTPCHCQVRQMTLSNPSLMTHPLQVKDILGYMCKNSRSSLYPSVETCTDEERENEDQRGRRMIKLD